MMPLRDPFVLATGRTLSLNSLDQWRVYAGLLEGVPREKLNDKFIAKTLERAQRRDGHAPFLIQPEQRPLRAVHGDLPPYGNPATLPAICCVGRFMSDEPARDPDMNQSALTVIWYQDDYAFPLSDDVARAIRKLDWEKLARDEERS